MKRIAVISINAASELSYALNTDSFFKGMSGNIGNMAFAYTAHLLIDAEKVLYSQIPASEKKDLAKHFDALVFPAANNLNPNEDLGWLADIIEPLEMPILIYGLGAQANLNGDGPDLTDGTKRFLEILRRKEIQILVRGDYTKDFLAKFGLDNVTSFGCASNLINPAPGLGADIENRFNYVKSHGAVTVALNLEYFRLEAKVVQIFIRYLLDRAGRFVVQSDESMFSLIRDRAVEVSLETEKMQWISKYFLGDTYNVDSFPAFIKDKGIIFGNLPSWLEFLRSCDLSIGSRFHGNILALQAGTPAVVFIHDSRTKELCDCCKVPYLLWDDVDSYESLVVALSNVQFSGHEYDINRTRMARVFCDYLHGNGLAPIETLSSLALKSAV